MQSSTSRGYFLAFISTFFLSTTAIFIRYLTVHYQIPAFVLAFWRDIFVVLTLLFVFLVIDPKVLRISLSAIPQYLLYGLVLALFNILWTFSVETNGAAVATVLIYTSVAFTAVLAWLFLSEGLGVFKLTAIGLSILGCVFVAGAYDVQVWQISLFGISTGIGAGLGYALYSLLGRSFAKRQVNIWTSLFYTFGFAALYLLIANFLSVSLLPALPGTVTGWTGYLWLENAWLGWLILFLLGAVPTVLGFGLYNASMQYLPSSIANLVATTEPVFTTITAYLFLGEVLAPAQIFGSLLIVSAVLLVRLRGLGVKKKGTVIAQSN